MVNYIKRVVRLAEKRTSIRLADFEWSALENICRRENIRRNKLLKLISIKKSTKLGFTPAVRLFILAYFDTCCSDFLFIGNPKVKNLNISLKSIK